MFNEMNNAMGNMFNGLFGKVADGLVKLTMNGNMAVKTSNGYKYFNTEKETLVNAGSFVFNGMSEFFYVIPSNKVTTGDIILVGGKPKCVVNATKTVITAIDYETSEIKQILPERHIFMGNTYFYGKIVSMFGNNAFLSSKKGGAHVMQKMMKTMMMMEMMKGTSGNSNNMFPMMMLMNGGNMFGGMFDNMFDDLEPMEDLDLSDDETEECPTVKSNKKSSKK